MFGGLKNSRTFASLSKGSTSENRGFGEVAEWSIAAVLKTVVLRGTRGSNPCLSATRGSNPCLSADKGCKSSNYEIYILFFISKFSDN